MESRTYIDEMSSSAYMHGDERQARARAAADDALLANLFKCACSVVDTAEMAARGGSCADDTSVYHAPGGHRSNGGNGGYSGGSGGYDDDHGGDGGGICGSRSHGETARGEMALFGEAPHANAHAHAPRSHARFVE
eukprot:4237411-Pleurochrysis_carterae.AAC.1